MSPELRALIEEHRTSLRRMLTRHDDLIRRLATEQPTLIEREALAAVMHSFYMGIEAILRGITTEHDGRPAKSDHWHRALLAGMAAATPTRPALLSEATAARLRTYLDYRHRFRNLYTDALDWDLMRALVLGMNATLAAFEAELDEFLPGRA